MKEEAKPSFSKALFSGIILDDLIFPYPQMDAEETENLDMMTDTFRKFAADQIDTAKIDKEGHISDDILNGL